MTVRYSPRVIGVVLLLAATLAASKLTTRRRAGSLATPLSAISYTIDGFVGRDNPPLTPGVLRELRLTSYLSRTYVKDRMTADLLIAYYAQQRAGESMHSPKHCLPGAGWEIWNYATAAVPVNGRLVRVNRYSIRKETSRAIVLYWYQSKERIIASEYMGKILLARDALLYNSTAASIVRIVVPDNPGAQEAAMRLASSVIPELQRCYGE